MTDINALSSTQAHYSAAWTSELSLPLKLWPTFGQAMSSYLGFRQRPSPACSCPRRLSPSSSCWLHHHTLSVTARVNHVNVSNLNGASALTWHGLGKVQPGKRHQSPLEVAVAADELSPHRSSASSTSSITYFHQSTKWF